MTDRRKQGRAARVLAVDPSTRCLGLALLDGEKVVWAYSHRLKGELANRLEWTQRIIGNLAKAHKPDVVVQETPGSWTRGSAHSRTDTVEKLAMVRGCVMAGATGKGVRCEEMTVGAARRIICGRGNAPKDEAYAALKMEGYELPTKDGKPDYDAADAVVVGLAWGRRARFEAMEVQL